MDTQVIGFLKGTPNSNKAAITAATGIKGLPLYSALKALLKEGRITSTGEGNETTYSLDAAISWLGGLLKPGSIFTPQKMLCVCSE